MTPPGGLGWTLQVPTSCNRLYHWRVRLWSRGHCANPIFSTTPNQQPKSTLFKKASSEQHEFITGGSTHSRALHPLGIRNRLPYYQGRAPTQHFQSQVSSQVATVYPRSHKFCWQHQGRPRRQYSKYYQVTWGMKQTNKPHPAPLGIEVVN